MRSITALVAITAVFALAITEARADAPDKLPAEEPAPKDSTRNAAPAAPGEKVTPASATTAPSAEETSPQVPGPAAAPATAGFPGSGFGLLVEPRVGGFLPSGRLGMSASAGVQFGRILSEDKQLWAIAELAFARPTLRGRGGTAEEPLGTFRYRLAVDDYSVLLGSRMMFPTRFERFTPFAEAGVKLHVLHSTSTGRSDSLGSFGTTEETSLAPGLALRGGAAYRLGPGAVSAALELGYARVDQDVTGDVWFGGLGFYGGYLYAF